MISAGRVDKRLRSVLPPGKAPADRGRSQNLTPYPAKGERHDEVDERGRGVRMSVTATRRRFPLLVAATIVGTGTALGLVASNALPAKIRLALLASLGCLFALDLVLFSNSRLPQYLVGATIIGMGVANGALAVSPAMNYGRFLPPLLLFVVVVRLGCWRHASRHSRRITTAACVGVTLVFLSVLTSLDPRLTVERSVAFAAVAVGLCAALRWSTTQEARLRNAVLATFAILVLSNLAMLFIGGDAYSGSRFRGWTINPNNLAVLCAFAVPVSASEAMTQRGRRRLIGAAILVIASLLLLLSGSRASSLGALLGFATVLRVSQVARSIVFVGSSFALLVLAPLAYRSASDANLLTAAKRPGNSAREQVWPVAVREVWNRPILGAGFSTTEERFAQEEFGRFSIFGGSHFHNSYLEAAVELGVPGGLLLVAAGLFSLSLIVRPVSVELGWAAGMAVSGAVVGVFETGLLAPGSVLMFPFWLAIGVLTRRRRRQLAPANPSGSAVAGSGIQSGDRVRQSAL